MSVVEGVPPPPDLRGCDKEVLALAKYLRHSDAIKQRPSLMGGQRWDMFKIKRAVRVMLDPAYEKARISNPRLPKISDRVNALQTLARFPNQRFAYNVTKLETEDAIAKGLKPQSGVPVVLLSPQQRVGDEEYFVWNYNPVPLKTYLYAVGLLAVGVAIALYQLWPMWARRGSYYVSLGCMGLVGLLLGISVVRIAIFLITVVILPKGFWLFPNLYADVGFFQSFKPVFAWSGDKTLPPKPKLKKRKSKAPKNNTETKVNAAAPNAGPVPAGAVPGVIPGAVPGAPGPGVTPGGGIPMLMKQTPNGPVPVGPLPQGIMPAGPDRPGQFVMHPMLKALLDVAMKRAEPRVQEILNATGPKSEDEIKQLKQQILQEEMGKVQAELKAAEALKQTQN